MTYPFPARGDVINYEYLFASDHASGATDGNKARPVIVVGAIDETVYVMPVTTKGEYSGTSALKIHPDAAKAMGLPRPDESYVLTSELNRFTWVGFDVRLVPGKTTHVFGNAQPGLVKSMIEHFQASGASPAVNRD